MAAGAAMEMGYTNILVFQGGVPAWTEAGYPLKSGPQPGKFK